MHARDSQRGLTFISWLLVLAVGLFFVLTGLKLYPGYYEAFGVKTSLNGLANDSDLATLPKVQIWKRLEKRFDINGINARDIGKDALIVEYDKKTKKRIIRLKYERRIPLYGNVDAMLRFDFPIQVDVTR